MPPLTTAIAFIQFFSFSLSSTHYAYQSVASRPASPPLIGGVVPTSPFAGGTRRRPGCVSVAAGGSPGRRTTLPLFKNKGSGDGGRTTVTMEKSGLLAYSGDDIDVRTGAGGIGDALREHRPPGEGGRGKGGVNGVGRESRNLIQCSTSIVLPFAREVAFDAYSDLTRQPSWSNYLRSVEYVGLVDENKTEDNNGINLPLRMSKWTVGVKGLKFSWISNDTRMLRPSLIEWESVSGLRNKGSVEFTLLPSRSTAETLMTLRFAFAAPRAVSGLFRRSGRIRRYTEDILLANTLAQFRDVVIEEDLS